MKVYLIICAGKTTVFHHNIIGRDFFDAIKNVLDTNLEYFGNNPKDAGLTPSIINKKKYLDYHNLKKYTQWHIHWLYSLQNEFNKSNIGYLIFDITNNTNVKEMNLEKLLK
jgi:hypothetical protein